MGPTAVVNQLYYTCFKFLIIKPNNILQYLSVFILIFHIPHKICKICIVIK